MAHKVVPYTFLKNDVFYFQRRVPSDLKVHYRSNRITVSLRTRNAKEARSRVQSMISSLDKFWSKLRNSDENVPGRHLLIAAEDQGQRSGPTLTDALEIYLAQKGPQRPQTFDRAARRVVSYVVKISGNKPLLAFTKKDAITFRDSLFERGMTSGSVQRLFGTIRAIVNFAYSEFGISSPNVFGGVFLKSGVGVTVREPIPIGVIRNIQRECRKTDDDLRWLVALISDTGMRLAEAAGLSTDDIVLDATIPHAVIRPHEWRSLKNKGSQRIVPLVGEALWAAIRIKKHVDGPFAFPRYTKNGQTNANSASAALNKWLMVHAGDGYSMHSFRHSLRDRLRAVECPADIVDQIGGWATAGQGQAYGKGYPLEVLQRWALLLAEDARKL